jgi:hypothetical protein
MTSMSSTATNAKPAAPKPPELSRAEYLTFLQKPGASPVGTMDAPELGDGAVLYLRRLSFAALNRLTAIGADTRTPEEQAREMLPIALALPDGSPAFDDTPDGKAAVARFVAERSFGLIQRVIDECIRQNRPAGGADAAKKD